MKVSELIEKLGKMDPNSDIVTYNRTSRRWFKTGNSQNYPVNTVEEIYPNCGDYAKKQLDQFSKTDTVFFF